MNRCEWGRQKSLTSGDYLGTTDSLRVAQAGLAAKK